MKYLSLILIFLLGNSFAFTQQIIIRVENLNQEIATLYSLSGETSEFVDTLSAINEETFQFSLAEKHLGFYSLSLNNNTKIDFIYDNEDVEIITDANNILDSLKVIKSESNKIYYDFIKLNKGYKTKTELLQLIIARYPQTDNYYQITKEKLNQIQEEYLYFINVTAQLDSKSFIARYIHSSQLPVVNSEILQDQYLNYLKSHALDNINFSDDALIYSDVFTNKVIEYLSYYRNPQLPMGLLEKEFQTAVDSILNKAKVNDIVYKHIVEYLLDGFKKFGFDNVINYIVDNYVIKDEICLDEKLSTTLERRINQSKYLKLGDSVSNFVLPDSSGALIELNKIQAEKILIIFYASWCPHCKTLLPQVSELYKKQSIQHIEVVAVSIDTLKIDWQNFVNNNNLTWINISDLKGWGGKAAVDYYVYATPTMFLIDRNRNIIAKPTSLDEIKSYF